MEKKYTIRRVNNNELDDAFSLIWTVFKQFVAPDYTKEETIKGKELQRHCLKR